MIVAAVVHAGGRARIDLSQVPKQVTAGKRFDLAIKVVPESWSHDRSIEPLVVAQRGDLKVTASSVSRTKSNHYKASLKLPSAGQWKVRVDSHYCETVMKPVEIRAVAAETAKRVCETARRSLVSGLPGPASCGQAISAR